MPTVTCKKCSSSNLEQNDAAGSLICTDCGTVCEENQIVIEQAWGTDAGGGSMMIGTFILGFKNFSSFKMKSFLYEICFYQNPMSAVMMGSAIQLIILVAKETVEKLPFEKRKIPYDICVLRLGGSFGLALCLVKGKLLTSEKLRLKEYHIDESYRFYKLALNHNFTRGRKAEQVYASCVYLSCRTAQRPTEHMLLGILSLLFCIFFKITIIFSG